MWLLPFFLKTPATSALNLSKALSSKLHKFHKERTIISYTEVISYHPETYATGVVITKMDTKTLHFTSLSNRRLTEYAETLCSKGLRCDLVYDKYVINGIFIVVLHVSIRQSKGLY